VTRHIIQIKSILKFIWYAYTCRLNSSALTLFKRCDLTVFIKLDFSIIDWTSRGRLLFHAIAPVYLNGQLPTKLLNLGTTSESSLAWDTMRIAQRGKAIWHISWSWTMYIISIGRVVFPLVTNVIEIQWCTCTV